MASVEVIKLRIETALRVLEVTEPMTPGAATLRSLAIAELTRLFDPKAAEQKPAKEK